MFYTNMSYKYRKKMFLSVIFNKISRTIATGILVSGIFLGNTGLQAANPQQKTVTLKVANAPIVKVLEEIRKQTGYNFMYNEKYVKNLREVTLDIRQLPVEEALKEVLKGTDLKFKIQDDIIILQENKVPQQQFRTLKGVVKDEGGEPVPGATILLKGTTIGVASGIDGQFSLDVPAGEDMLLVSFIGMETQEVKFPSNKSSLEVILKPHVDKLDEVVVTGYTQTTKRRAVGSVAVVDKKIFENKVQTNVDHLLQGQVAGVNVMATSGRPGESAKIRIRGTNTITGNAEPLWIVDGVPLSSGAPNVETSQIKSGDFNDIFMNGIGGINPNDIENVTILKNAAAAAIYGSRAAGGVIVVTTKRGKAGKMRVNYAANVNVTLKPQHDANLMNSKEKLAWEQELWNEFAANGFNSGDYYPVVGIVGTIRAGKGKYAGMSAAEQDAAIQELSGINTDWYDILFRNAVSTNHHLSFSGGKEGYTYYFSLGFSQDNGLVKKTDYKRYDVSGNMSLRPKEQLQMVLNFGLAQQRSGGPSMSVDPFTYAYFANPYESPYNQDGSYRADETYYSLKRINGGYEQMQDPAGFNILREMDKTSNVTDGFSSDVKLEMDYAFSTKLHLKGLGSYSFRNNKSDDIKYADSYAAFSDRLFFDSYMNTRKYGSIYQVSSNSYDYNLQALLNYSDKYGDDHRLTVFVGAQIDEKDSKTIYEKRYGYDEVTGQSSIPVPPKPSTGSGNIDYDDMLSYGMMVDGLSGQQRSKDRMASFFGAAEYYLKDRYILSASFRMDGTNKFGSDKQFNPTWSAGAAWHIGDEMFMSLLKPTLSRMTLRLSSGYRGTINTQTLPNLIMSYESNYRKMNDMNYRMGMIKNAPNPNLRWEKTFDVTASLDFALWEERLAVLMEYYYSKSIDCVTHVAVPVSTGFSDQGFNTSEIGNKGIEATVQAKLLDFKNFQWNLSVNVAYNQNKVLKYSSPSGTLYIVNFPGYPTGAIFSGEYTGIDPATGIYKFQLRPDAVINKETDYAQTANYIHYLGTSNAPVNGGFNTSFSYKNFSLGVSGSFWFGRKFVNDIAAPSDYSSAREGTANVPIPTKYNDLYTNHFNVTKDRTDRWTSSRPTGTKYPRIIDAYGPLLKDVSGETIYIDQNTPVMSMVTRGALLENVSFLRINAITLSYSLPEKILRPIGVSSCGLSLSMNNFFTFSDYSGIDPELPGNTYPTSRSCAFSVSIGF